VKVSSSFSVDNLKKAKQFYGPTLELECKSQMKAHHSTSGGNEIFIYPKADYTRGTFTILSFS
jgi:hypothetical protein